MTATRILIYGVPGSGKTALSGALQEQLGCPVVEADRLREEAAQKEKTREEEPFVYMGTTEAFRAFGGLTEENAIKGLEAVRQGMAAYVAEEIAKHEGEVIVEGAFLNPRLLAGGGTSVLIVTSDEAKHRSQYFQHRNQSEDQLEYFRAARMIQGYLLNEARDLRVHVIENDLEIGMLAQKTLDILKQVA